MLKNTPYRNYFYLAIALNIITAASVLIFKGALPPLVPLFYGRPVGASELIGSFGLIIAPAVSLGIALVNLFITKLVDDIFLKKALILSAFFASLLTSITVLKIIFLVGFF